MRRAPVKVYNKMRKLLVGTVFFLSSISSSPNEGIARSHFLCNQGYESEDTNGSYVYSCELELEPSTSIAVDFPPVSGNPFISLIGNYTKYAGKLGTIESCIRTQNIGKNRYKVAVRVFNECATEKYVVIEMSVP